MMKLEEELPDAMRDTVQGVQPDIASLVAGGVERGRREVRRARIAKAVGAGAVLAMVGGLAIALPLDGGAKPAEQQVAGTTRTVVPPPPAKVAPPKAATTPQAALQLLLDQLSAAANTGLYGGYGEPGKWVRAQLIHADATGKSRVTVSLDVGELTKSQWDGACDTSKLKKSISLCTTETLEDGSTLLLVKSDYPDGRKDQLFTVVLKRADQVQVTLTASGTEKGAPPPFTLERLTAIAKSSVWQANVDKAFADEAMERFGPLEVDPMHPQPK